MANNEQQPPQEPAQGPSGLQQSADKTLAAIMKVIEEQNQILAACREEIDKNKEDVEKTREEARAALTAHHTKMDQLITAMNKLTSPPQQQPQGQAEQPRDVTMQTVADETGRIRSEGLNLGAQFQQQFQPLPLSPPPPNSAQGPQLPPERNTLGAPPPPPQPQNRNQFSFSAASSSMQMWAAAPAYPDPNKTGYNIDDWLRDLQNTAMMCEWTPTAMLFQAIKSVDITTRRKIERLNMATCPNIAQGIKLMTRALKGSEYQFQEIAKCVSRDEEIKPNETFAMYADRVVKNYERMLAGPKHDGNPETLKVTMLRFCAGLRNTELSKEVRRLIKTAKSMDEIVEACEESQSTTDFLIKRNGPADGRRYELDDDVQEINKAKLSCFYCKKKGHFKRDCYKYKNSLKSDDGSKQKSGKQSNRAGGSRQGRSGNSGSNRSRRNDGKGGSRRNRRVQELENDGSEDEADNESSMGEDEEDDQDVGQDKDFQ